MRKIERIGFVVILSALLLKLFKIPGAGISFVLISSFLAVFYFLFTFPLLNDIRLTQLFVKTSYSKVTFFKSVGLIGLGVGISLVIMGLMFVIQHWPGGMLNLIIGGATLLTIGIITIVKKARPYDDSFYNNVLLRVCVWIAYGAISLFI